MVKYEKQIEQEDLFCHDCQHHYEKTTLYWVDHTVPAQSVAICKGCLIRREWKQLKHRLWVDLREAWRLIKLVDLLNVALYAATSVSVAAFALLLGYAAWQGVIIK